ncbi:MAG: COX15/CtaA family protein [Alphaproteobacteria bacterium]|nr:COX15/CtaA family protein [Alphaproteobacteria bacterium]
MTQLPATEAAVYRWLLLCCAMIFAMAVIGAITRLTESGLSIVEWAPISGAVPPFTDADWNKAFAAYQQIPQYKLLKSGMSLAEFKDIYFWEWLHRLWGRLIGLVYALPFFWFMARRQIPTGYSVKLWLGLVLGGLQGAVGWFMVASGLSQLVFVSHYRLALHLSLALLIYAYLLWLAFGLKPAAQQSASRGHGWLALGCVALTIIWGAFVAGLKAGWVYNTFPLMDGALVPEAGWTLEPSWQNFFANTALVQFSHRILAMITGLIVWSWYWRLWRQGAASKITLALGGMVVVQIGLGIATLLSQVNIILGTLHQAGAIVLLTLLLRQIHTLKPVQSP